jgi:RimJ/RimL family protein N-acetyltransferase
LTGEVVAETGRVLIRDWRPDEEDRFFDIYRRWEVSRWLGAAPAAMQDRDEARARIARWAELNAADDSLGRWAIERRDDGAVAGTVLLVRLPDGDGELEVGWHLHPDSWGHGYATEAAAAVLARAFAGGVPEVFAVVRPDNAASLAVCRRLGMEPLGRTDRYYQAELELFRAGRR